MTEAQGGLKLFPAIKVYGKIFIDKNRLGHFNVFREIFEEFLPKRFGKNLTDAQLDSLFEKGNPVEGFAFYHPTTKELHFLSREESHKKFNIHSTEQL
jgi:hypothetical protein